MPRSLRLLLSIWFDRSRHATANQLTIVHFLMMLALLCEQAVALNALVALGDHLYQLLLFQPIPHMLRVAHCGLDFLEALCQLFIVLVNLKEPVFPLDAMNGVTCSNWTIMIHRCLPG